MQQDIELLKQFVNLIGHLVTFQVDTPSSKTGQTSQVPILLVTDIRKAQSKHLYVKGVDFKKIVTPDDVKIFRSYRLDRIRGTIHDLGTIQDHPYTSHIIEQKPYISF